MNPSTILQALKDPDNPAFHRALEELAKLDPTKMKREDFPAFLAQLDETITHLTRARDATAAELQKLRQRATAFSSYERHK